MYNAKHRHDPTQAYPWTIPSEPEAFEAWKKEVWDAGSDYDKIAALVWYLLGVREDTYARISRFQVIFHPEHNVFSVWLYNDKVGCF